MNAFIKFNKGLLKMSTPVRLWLLVLVTVNPYRPFIVFGTTRGSNCSGYHVGQHDAHDGSDGASRVHPNFGGWSRSLDSDADVDLAQTQ